MENTIYELLKEIGEKLDEKKSVIAETGEEFNIFKILDITSDEVRLHSAFIANLLDPKGTHGYGTKFLQEFLIQSHVDFSFPILDNVKVFVEYHVSKIEDKNGGRIDILLIDNQENAIIIENKIYASDQVNQLIRYKNFGKSLKGNHKLLYLNLYGNQPKSSSLGGEVIDFSIITYHTDIYNWLNACMVISEKTPLVAQGIHHYINLIKNLTNQDYQKSTDMEIINSINETVGNYNAAVAIQSNLLEAKVQLLRRIGKRLRDKVKNELSDKIKSVFYDEQFGYQYHGMELSILDLGDAPKYRPQHIRFSFLSNANDCYIEIHPGVSDGINLEKDIKRRESFKKKLEAHFQKTRVKVENTEINWQGEWVCRYRELDDKYEDIITHEDVLFNRVYEDLKYVIDVFSAENISN